MSTKEYKVRAPDGSVLRFKAPADAPKEKILAFAKMQFEKMAEREPIEQAPQAVVSGRGIAGQQAQSKREKALEELEKVNPFQAQALREMSPVEKALVGAGAGFSELAAGLGLRESSKAEELAKSQLAEISPSFEAGRLVGQAAPFAGAGVVAGGLLKGAPLAARAATQGGLGAAEGGIIAKGTGGTTEDIIAGTGAGLLIGGGAEALAPYIGRIGRAIVQKVKGEPPAGRLLDDAGRPTAELKSALDESGQTFDEVVEEAARQQKADTVGDVVRAGRRGDFEAVDIEADPKRVAAAKAEGLLEQTPAAVLTKDQAAQELAGALAAVQGTRQSTALDAYSSQLGERADDLIKELGGSLDRGQVSQDLLTSMSDDIQRIKAAEDVLYKGIRDNVGEGTLVNVTPIKNLLAARARTRRGVRNLSQMERNLYSKIKDGKFTFAQLDDEIKEIGAAIGRETDVYKNTQLSTLNDMYGKLSQLREGVAETFGQGQQIKKAKEIGAKRFGLQAATKQLFGKDLQGSLFRKIDSPAKGLSAGNVKEFEAVMETIPQEHRKPVVATMLNTALTGGRDQSLGINASQFAKWYKNIERQPSAMAALTKYAGEDAVKRLANFAELSKGLAGVTRGRVRTGITSEALKRLDDINGVAGKLYGAARKVQDVPVVGTGAATVANTAKLFTLDKTPAVEAADELLGSTKFKRAMVAAAESGVNTQKFKRLNAQLKAAPAYRKYINQLDDSRKADIAAAGLIAWLASEEGEE